MKKWLFLVTAILMEVAASLALRAAMDHPAWYVLVVVGYTSAFVLISATLRLGTPIGVAYGIWAASGVALTALLGAFIFGDPLTWTMGTGIMLIIGGVMLVELGAGRPRAKTPEGTR